MLKSMTGFGRCLVENAICSQQWEIKSVNSKYLDIRWHLPLLARYLEPGLEKIVRRFATRGKVEISLQMQFCGDYLPEVKFNLDLAKSRILELEKLALSRGHVFLPDYSSFLAIPEFWGNPAIDEDIDLSGITENGLRIALEDWNESRAVEGDNLGRDLQNRILRMEEWLEVIRQNAPEIKDEKIAALRERLSDALEETGATIDEQRFFQEIVILADRLDVSEELVRLATHLQRLSDLLALGEDVGRKLDFTLQECFREINTCGNKLPNPQLSRIIVDFKNELEKCREQAQNIE